MTTKIDPTKAIYVPMGLRTLPKKHRTAPPKISTTQYPWTPIKGSSLIDSWGHAVRLCKKDGVI